MQMHKHLIIFVKPTEATKYLCGETEESLWFHHFFQHVTLDARRAVILVYDPVLQVDVVYCQTHMVLLPIDDCYCIQLVHHLWNRRNAEEQ